MVRALHHTKTTLLKSFWPICGPAWPNPHIYLYWAESSFVVFWASSFLVFYAFFFPLATGDWGKMEQKREREMEESGKKKGLEGTGLSLPKNLHGNLRSASGDEQFMEILSAIKASKSPVTSLCLFLNLFGYWYIFLYFHWFIFTMTSVNSTYSVYSCNSIACNTNWSIPYIPLLFNKSGRKLGKNLVYRFLKLKR